MSNSQVLSAVTEIGETVKTRIEAQDKRIKELDSAITEIVQQGAGFKSVPGTNTRQTLGDAAVKAFSENAELFSKSGRVTLELKAASDAVTTTSGRTIESGGVGAPGMNMIGLQYALPTREAIGLTALEYSRYTGIEGAAAVQATEGADKAAVRPGHSLIAQSSITLAGYTVMSRQALSDSNELRQAVEVTLTRSVANALDALLYDGSVTPAWTGFETLSTAFASTKYSVLADAISETVADMQEEGFQPTVVVLSPATWVQVCTERADTGTGLYLGGNYLGQIEPAIRGLRVVLSASVRAGCALVVDTAHTELLTVQRPNITIGTVDQQFTQNLATLLLELRVIPVFRTTGASRLAVPDGVSI